MSDDFYPFVDSGDPAPDNAHITGASGAEDPAAGDDSSEVSYATRIAIYDDMLSTPRVIVIAPKDVRTYLEEVTNTVYRCMKEQGGGISLMVIREIVENFIHADFVEPIISILDDGNTIRFADQGPGIDDKERAFEFGVTSADRSQKRYIRGTGAGFPMVQQYLENAGGAISIEDNMHQGTVVTVSIDPHRAVEIEHAGARGAAVRAASGLDALIPPASVDEAAAAGAMASGRPEAGAAPYPGMPNAAHPGDTDPWAGAPAWSAPAAQPAPQAGAGFGQAAQPYPQQGWGYPAAAYPGQPMPGQALGAQQPYPQQPYYPQGFPAPYPQQPGAWGQPPYPAGGWAQQPYGAAAAPAAQQPAAYVSERGAQALHYLLEHESGGPTDLAHAYGSSAPTWSRELESLAQAGLVVKRGQKRFLTPAGRQWIQEQH